MRKDNLLDALFPQTRQSILGALLVSPERRWYLSHLAQHIGVTPSSLQRELASLTSAGILERTADSNRIYYQANLAFPLLPELQRLFAKTVGLSDELKAMLQPFWVNIAIAFVFGSVARGERTANSDVDVLIVGSVGMSDLALSLRTFERTLQVPINMTVFSGSEFQDKIRGHNHFLQTILSGEKIFLKGSDDDLANFAGKPTAKSALHE